jgi:hypothetical protein
MKLARLLVITATLALAGVAATQDRGVDCGLKKAAALVADAPLPVCQ